MSTKQAAKANIQYLAQQQALQHAANLPGKAP